MYFAIINLVCATQKMIARWYTTLSKEELTIHCANVTMFGMESELQGLKLTNVSVDLSLALNPDRFLIYVIASVQALVLRELSLNHFFRILPKFCMLSYLFCGRPSAGSVGTKHYSPPSIALWTVKPDARLGTKLSESGMRIPTTKFSSSVVDMLHLLVCLGVMCDDSKVKFCF